MSRRPFQRKPPEPSMGGETVPHKLLQVLDANRDGKVTDAEAQLATTEFQKQANEKPITPQGSLLLETLDKNDDGSVDKPEAQAGVARGRLQQGGTSQAVAEAFYQLDRDADGQLGRREFAAVVGHSGRSNRLVKRHLNQFFSRM